MKTDLLQYIDQVYGNTMLYTNKKSHQEFVQSPQQNDDEQDVDEAEHCSQ